MLTTRVTQRLFKRQTIGVFSQVRYLATAPPPEAPAKPQKYGVFRQAPLAIGARDPPVVDHQNWFQRKKQKLRDFTDYEKAFAAHAAERRHL
jgi:ATPase complex subunit ATP10